MPREIFAIGPAASRHGRLGEAREHRNLRTFLDRRTGAGVGVRGAVLPSAGPIIGRRSSILGSRFAWIGPQRHELRFDRQAVSTRSTFQGMAGVEVWAPTPDGTVFEVDSIALQPH